MSNFDATRFLYDDDRSVRVGPEIINGTGEVWLDATPIRVLTNAQARELAAALVEAADFSEAVQREARQPVEWPPGATPDGDYPPGSVHSYEWTDPAWRGAVGPGGQTPA